MARYRITAGVHRSVAALKAGSTQVRGRVDRGGVLGPIELLPLDELFSGKREIGRWDQGRDFLELIRIMGDPSQCQTVEPIVVTPVSERLARYFTPLADVIVNPV